MESHYAHLSNNPREENSTESEGYFTSDKTNVRGRTFRTWSSGGREGKLPFYIPRLGN
jgi:hypothetical protein